MAKRYDTADARYLRGLASVICSGSSPAEQYRRKRLLQIANRFNKLFAAAEYGLQEAGAQFDAHLDGRTLTEALAETFPHQKTVEQIRKARK